MPWFSRLALPLDAAETRLANDYVRALGLHAAEIVEGWPEAERLTRDPASGEGWWAQEEDERRRLMREMAGRIGDALLFDSLTAAVEGAAAATFAAAVAAGGDEALARVASGAALMALHNRSLALLANRGPGHLFM